MIFPHLYNDAIALDPKVDLMFFVKNIAAQTFRSEHGTLVV